jgi:hypothetical protein
MNWVIQNKEWLFSGAGVALVALVGGLLWKIIHNRRRSYARKHEVPDSSSQQILAPAPNDDGQNPAASQAPTRRNVLKWVIQNKEWLFSGAGLVLLTLVGGLLWKIIHNRGQNPAASQAPTRENVLKVEVREMLADIKSRPLYQRDEAMKHYVGLSTRFEGKFSSLLMGKDGRVKIMLSSLEPIPSAFVSFDISIDEHPEFKIMRENTPITVQGKIAGCDWDIVKLEEVTIIR